MEKMKNDLKYVDITADIIPRTTEMKVGYSLISAKRKRRLQTFHIFVNSWPHGST